MLRMRNTLRLRGKGRTLVFYEKYSGLKKMGKSVYLAQGHALWDQERLAASGPHEHASSMT
jgi:hypothetical protein